MYSKNTKWNTYDFQSNNILLQLMLLILFLSYLTTLTATSAETDQRIITTLKYSRFQVKPTILNGDPAKEGQVPYMVSLKEPVRRISKNRKLWRNLCGGSIISDMRVITAAHCFEGNNFYYTKNPHILRVLAGNLYNELIYSGKTVTNRDGQWRKITRVVLHNSFYFPSADIALVFVDENWNFTDTVDYVNPATKRTDYGGDCFAYGFGNTEKSKREMSDVLVMAKIDILSRTQCSVIWEVDMDEFICTSSVISDVRWGDSGGPLTCRGTLDLAENGKDLLVGVVSGKNFDKTTLYTRVSSYKDWIERDRGSENGITLFVLIFCVLLLI